MFFDFFYELRKQRIPVSTGEYLDLMHALRGYSLRDIPVTPERFYLISRATLVKDVRFYDAFDLVFARLFSKQIGTGDNPFRQAIEHWLQRSAELTECPGQAPHLSPDELWKQLEERLKEQKERHDGGNKWIGTKCKSPFGHSGVNPAGVRIGGDERLPGNRSAIDTLGERRYREYRDDERLSVRQFQIALRRLRDLRREGRPQFSIPESVRRTADNAGVPEAVFVKSRKNRLRLLLLMDVGGSMSPHATLVSRLFSAASKTNHFGHFKHYYFHNVVYDYLFEDAGFSKMISIDEFCRKYDDETRLLYVGDACMSPYELFDKRHAFFEYYYRSGQTDEETLRQKQQDVLNGYERLRFLLARFPHTAWLNPDPPHTWHHETVQAIGDLIPMFPLTLDGLRRAVQSLTAIGR